MFFQRALGDVIHADSAAKRMRLGAVKEEGPNFMTADLHECKRMAGELVQAAREAMVDES